MLFAVVFGLSMDYEVFLLSRIKEEYDRTGDNATAVADGLAATARVITAAAAIMVCVFGAFALGPDRALKMFGIGMATAVFVDATIVRLILVPATMELLGDRNWWIPAWLDRILPARSHRRTPRPRRRVDRTQRIDVARDRQPRLRTNRYSSSSRIGDSGFASLRNPRLEACAACRRQHRGRTASSTKPFAS